MPVISTLGVSVKFELAPENRGVADEILLEDLRRIASMLKKDFLPREEYDAHGRFHPKTLVKRFGSWNKSLELAGLRIQKPNNLRKDDCLADLRQVAATLGKASITVEEYRQFGNFTEGPFRRLFGSWTNALQEAGLAVSSGYHPPRSEEQLHQNLEAVWRGIGRQPKQSDMRKPLSLIGHDAYCRRFGSWRKALEAFIAYVNGTSVQEQEPTVKENKGGLPISIATEAPRTGRHVSWRLRFLVMRRDGFKCRQCGRSPATATQTTLVIDHIVPWSKGGETIFANLQTLCEVCNGGKSDLSVADDAQQRLAADAPKAARR